MPTSAGRGLQLATAGTRWIQSHSTSTLVFCLVLLSYLILTTTPQAFRVLEENTKYRVLEDSQDLIEELVGSGLVTPQAVFDGSALGVPEKYINEPWRGKLSVQGSKLVLPKAVPRVPIFTYFPQQLASKDVNLDLEQKLLTSWKRAVTAFGFEPIVITGKSESAGVLEWLRRRQTSLFTPYCNVPMDRKQLRQFRASLQSSTDYGDGLLYARDSDMSELESKLKAGDFHLPLGKEQVFARYTPENLNAIAKESSVDLTRLVNQHLRAQLIKNYKEIVVYAEAPFDGPVKRAATALANSVSQSCPPTSGNLQRLANSPGSLDAAELCGFHKEPLEVVVADSLALNKDQLSMISISSPVSHLIYKSKSTTPDWLFLRTHIKRDSVLRQLTDTLLPSSAGPDPRFYLIRDLIVTSSHHIWDIWEDSSDNTFGDIEQQLGFSLPVPGAQDLTADHSPEAADTASILGAAKSTVLSGNKRFEAAVGAWSNGDMQTWKFLRAWIKGKTYILE